jgi:signal transduction histidine kinase
LDTKLKRSSPLAAWLAFFIGINILIASTIGGIYLAGKYRDISKGDYKGTRNFKWNVQSNFDLIIQSLESNKDFGWDYSNIVYFGSIENQKKQTNSEYKNFEEAVTSIKAKTSEYPFLVMWNGSDLSISDNGAILRASDDEVYSQMYARYAKQNQTKYKDYRVLIAVKEPLTVKYGGVYSSYIEWKLLGAAVPAVAISFGIGIVLLIISSIKRSSRKQFSNKLARLSGKVWIEVKIAISIFLLIPLSTNDDAVVIIGLVILFWWSYLMLIDLMVHGTGFFKNNSLTWVLNLYRSFENKKPFQKAMMNRFLFLVGIEFLLIFLVFALLVGGGDAVSFAFFFTALGVYFFYRYFRSYTKLITDIGKVVDQTELIRNGDLSTKLTLPVRSVMHKTADNLNHIQEGVSSAAQEQLRSERMKVELITNVSHDLKTPLTSIVNYIDLLSREELSPEHANDYVKVLSRKAARLTSLTQDLFDISKAQSGNLELNIERIDIVELIKQSIAELEERIAESGLNFRINLPQEKVYINADGRKLYRVFDNLISNILKYSLSSTRVYIDLFEDKDYISLSFKNIAAYEMNMSATDLMERFVRGDEARSTEGSGLGLAIVQSFVSLSGGEFNVDIDGDLFKAIVKFKKA